MPPASPAQRGCEPFLFVLLSAPHVGTEETRQRIQRLYHLAGGSNVAVILLLGEGGNQDMTAFMQLQME